MPGPLDRTRTCMTLSYNADIEEGVSHIELAHVVFDQWNLTISLRKYAQGEVEGMAQVIFPNVGGFRYLDEGEMLMYSFPATSIEQYVVAVETGGWAQQEREFGNLTGVDGYSEYLIATTNECLCVLSHNEPLLLRNT